jgi:hypothetical protein
LLLRISSDTCSSIVLHPQADDAVQPRKAATYRLIGMRSAYADRFFERGDACARIDTFKVLTPEQISRLGNRCMTGWFPGTDDGTARNGETGFVFLIELAN